MIRELSLPALDALWEDLRLGSIPFPLEVRSHGETIEERLRIKAAVYSDLENRGLKPHVVLSAQDSDVIKTYVELGLGVGILARMAFDEKRDRELRAIDASHLFESSTTRLGIKRGAYLRRYAYEFIELFAPQLPRAIVERAVVGSEGSRYEL